VTTTPAFPDTVPALMELVLELESVSVALTDPDDTKHFAVRIDGPPNATAASHLHRLGDVLTGLGLGRLNDEGDALVARDAVRFWAAGQVGPDWDQRFEDMCEYAAGKGWVDPVDGALQAHVVWPNSSD
jgi:hypothetical protein